MTFRLLVWYFTHCNWLYCCRRHRICTHSVLLSLIRRSLKPNLISATWVSELIVYNQTFCVTILTSIMCVFITSQLRGTRFTCTETSPSPSVPTSGKIIHQFILNLYLTLQGDEIHTGELVAVTEWLTSLFRLLVEWSSPLWSVGEKHTYKFTRSTNNTLYSTFALWQALGVLPRDTI